MMVEMIQRVTSSASMMVEMIQTVTNSAWTLAIQTFHS